MDDKTRTLAQRRFRVFWVLNAIPVAFLLDDILVLYGLRMGVPEPALAAMTSFVQLTMPFMLLGRLFSARYGLAGAWIRAYLIRYSAVSLLIFAPYIESLYGRTALVIACAFVFATFRAVGVINMHALNGEITSAEERGQYLHLNFALFNSAYLLAVVATIVATRVYDATWVYQAMVGVGVAVGFASLFALNRVPETGEGQRAAREPFWELFREVRSHVRLGVLIPGWAGANMTFALVVPFAILLVKKGYGVDDHSALAFTFSTVVGSVTAGLINRRRADKISPDTLVFGSGITLLGAALFWAFAPGHFLFPLVALVFFVMGVARASIIVGLQHHLISTNLPEHRMHVSLMVELTGSAVSGLTGVVIGSQLLRVLGNRLQGIDLYHAYFRIIIALLLVALYFVWRIRRDHGEVGQPGAE